MLIKKLIEENKKPEIEEQLFYIKLIFLEKENKLIDDFVNLNNINNRDRFLEKLIIQSIEEYNNIDKKPFSFDDNSEEWYFGDKNKEEEDFDFDTLEMKIDKYIKKYMDEKADNNYKKGIYTEAFKVIKNSILKNDFTKNDLNQSPYYLVKNVLKDISETRTRNFIIPIRELMKIKLK
jgi:hypothetical protein